MDRDSDHEHEELQENKEQMENGDDSDEDSDMDRRVVFMKRLQNELSQRRREDDVTEPAVEELRRIYESNNNNNNNSNSNNNNNNNNNSTNNNNNSNCSNDGGQGLHIPTAHRSPSCSNNNSNNNNNNPPSTSPFSAFAASSHVSRENLFQYGMNYLNTNAALQQQYSQVALAAGLNSLTGLQSSMLQPATSFQSSLSSSRIPSPHSQFQRQSPPQSYNHSPPNFQSPPPAHLKRSASVSSRQSQEESGSPGHQNSNWSFEEQFKQLYDIDRDDPKRKEFLDDLFTFMQKHETPVTRLPIMAKSVLDLYELYKLVVQRGGLVDVINKKLWQEVIKGLNLPSSITSAAFTLRTQYMKFLYRYECHKLQLSTPAELSTAIEGNKREGRRTSYYGDIGQIQSPNSNGAPNNGHQGGNSLHHQSQMSPVSMVPTSTLNSASTRLQVNGHSNHYGSNSTNASIPTAHGLSPLILQGAAVPLPTENRILDYIKLMNSRMMSNPSVNGSSPELPEASNLPGLDAQLAFWNLYSGVMKQPLQQNPILPFQPSRPLSHNSTNEVPLDLGTSSRKREGDGTETSSPPPPLKLRIRDSEMVGEDETNESNASDDSDSDEAPECHIPMKNSSQNSADKNKLSSIVVKMKINGVNYKGVLHPTSNKIKFT